MLGPRGSEPGNQRLLEKRKSRLGADGTFRVPVGAPNKFRRSFHQSYSSDVKEVAEVKGSEVRATDGSRVDVKRILPVHEFSGEATQGLSGADPRKSKQKDIVMPLMIALLSYMDVGETISLLKASFEVKAQIGGKEFTDLLKKARLPRLVEAVELFDEFEVQRGGMYVKRVA